MIRVARKFNLSRIGHNYETIEIAVERETIQEAIDMIELCWRDYCKAIVEGRVT